MSDEQRRMIPFGTQPEGTGPFFRSSALCLAYIAVLNRTRQALICKKMADGDAISISIDRP